MVSTNNHICVNRLYISCMISNHILCFLHDTYLFLRVFSEYLTRENSHEVPMFMYIRLALLAFYALYYVNYTLSSVIYNAMNFPLFLYKIIYRDHSGHGLSQWAMTLQCNVSHWLKQVISVPWYWSKSISIASFNQNVVGPYW